MLPLVDRPLLAYTFEHLRRHGVRRGDRLVRLPADADPGALRRRATASSRSTTRSRRSRSAPAARSGSPRRDRRDVLRAQRRLAARGRPRRARRLPPANGREGDDPAHAGRRPEPLRARPRRTATAGSRRFLEKPRPEEIDTNLINAGLYVLEPERARPDPARSRRLDRARGLPAALRRGVRLRARAAGLLARRGDARRLPAGAPRRARAPVPHRGRRRARSRLHARRPVRRGHPEARLVPPVYVGEDARIGAGAASAASP